MPVIESGRSREEISPCWSKVSVPAKINLWLEVIRKREDGYHDLSSLMLPVGIYDCLELESMKGRASVSNAINPAVPADASNLAWRAAEAFLSSRWGRGRGAHPHHQADSGGGRSWRGECGCGCGAPGFEPYASERSCSCPVGCSGPRAGSRCAIFPLPASRLWPRGSGSSSTPLKGFRITLWCWSSLP